MPHQVVVLFTLALFGSATVATLAAGTAATTGATVAAGAKVAAGGTAAAAAGPRPRARDLGVPFDGTPGPLNAITDVDGVLVGHTTLIEGSGKLVVGKGPVRTGVTAVLPRGTDSISICLSPAGTRRTATVR